MTALIVLAVLFLLILLLLLCPVQIAVAYDGKFRLKVGAAGIRFRIFPSDRELLEDSTLSPRKKQKIQKKLLKKAARAEKKAEKKAAKKAKEALAGKHKKKRGKEKASDGAKKKEGPKAKGILRDIRFLARAAKILLLKFGRRLHVKLKRLEIVVASPDAAKTAYLFGGVSQAVAYLLRSLDAYSRLSFRNETVSVKADFLKEKLSADIDILFSIRVGSLLSLALSALWLFVKEGFAKKSSNAEKNEPDTGKDSKKDPAADRSK